MSDSSMVRSNPLQRVWLSFVVTRFSGLGGQAAQVWTSEEAHRILGQRLLKSLTTNKGNLTRQSLSHLASQPAEAGYYEQKPTR